jgi:hypothetical protein
MQLITATTELGIEPQAADRRLASAPSVTVRGPLLRSWDAQRRKGTTMGEISGEGPDVYHGYSVDDEDQPQGYGDSLSDDRGLREPLDEGYSPPDRWSSAQGFGNTAYEAGLGERLAHRLAQEEIEPDPYAWRADPPGLRGTQVGGRRAGDVAAFNAGLDEVIVERSVLHEWDTDPFGAPAGQEPYWGRQVGALRAGRLASYDEGLRPDEEKDVVAFDLGIDGAAASAEEAAMHVINDDFA